MDETWIHHYIPESNRSSAEWREAGESRSKRVKASRWAVAAHGSLIRHHDLTSLTIPAIPWSHCVPRSHRQAQMAADASEAPTWRSSQGKGQAIGTKGRPKSSPEHDGSGSDGEASSSSLEPGEIRRKAPARNPRQMTTTPLSSISSNRFAALIDSMDADEAEEETLADPDLVPTVPVKNLKPPPIFVPDVSDIKGFITDVALAIGNLRFDYKSGRDGRVRVNLEDKDSFTKLKDYLNENEIRYQTFQAKDERAYRIVVKGLHFSTEIDEIKEALAVHGHMVRGREIKNAISRTTKKPMSLFFVNLEPASNDAEHNTADVEHITPQYPTYHPMTLS
ncbi:hypothetical protein ACLKA6_002301 [Drosophila palustris]